MEIIYILVMGFFYRWSWLLSVCNVLDIIVLVIIYKVVYLFWLKCCDYIGCMFILVIFVQEGVFDVKCVYEC